MAMIAIFIAMIVAYAAFALRAFYLRPGLFIQPGVDPSAADAISLHYASLGGVSCPRLNWPRVRYALIHPLEARVTPAVMRSIGTVETWVVHGSRADFFLRDKSGQWNYKGTSEWMGGVLRP